MKKIIIPIFCIFIFFSCSKTDNNPINNNTSINTWSQNISENIKNPDLEIKNFKVWNYEDFDLKTQNFDSITLYKSSFVPNEVFDFTYNMQDYLDLDAKDEIKYENDIYKINQNEEKDKYTITKNNEIIFEFPRLFIIKEPLKNFFINDNGWWFLWEKYRYYDDEEMQKFNWEKAWEEKTVLVNNWKEIENFESFWLYNFSWKTFYFFKKHENLKIQYYFGWKIYDTNFDYIYHDLTYSDEWKKYNILINENLWKLLFWAKSWDDFSANIINFPIENTEFTKKDCISNLELSILNSENTKEILNSYKNQISQETWLIDYYFINEEPRKDYIKLVLVEKHEKNWDIKIIPKEKFEINKESWKVFVYDKNNKKDEINIENKYLDFYQKNCKNLEIFDEKINLNETETEEIVTKIRKNYENINLKSSFQKKSIEFDECSEWWDIDAFYENDKLAKIVASCYKTEKKQVKEFYFWDDTLFIFSQDNYYDINSLELWSIRIWKIEENRYYFYKKQLIRYLDENKKSVESIYFPDKQKELLDELELYLSKIK